MIGVFVNTRMASVHKDTLMSLEPLLYILPAPCIHQYICSVCTMRTLLLLPQKANILLNPFNILLPFVDFLQLYNHPVVCWWGSYQLNFIIIYISTIILIKFSGQKLLYVRRYGAAFLLKSQNRQRSGV